MTRLQATLIHLGISAFVLAGFFALVFFIWYPAPYFSIEGTNTIISILIGVDLFLGPLLTFVVFKSGKPGLKFDLSLIALFQIVALFYGAQTIYNERPYFIAFAYNQFNIISASELGSLNMAGLNTSEVDHSPLGPTYVYVDEPGNAILRLLIQLKPDSPGLERRPELYRHFKTNIARAYPDSLDLNTLASQYPGNKAIVQAFLDRHPDTRKLLFYPVAGKNRNGVLVLDRKASEVVDFIDLDPRQKRHAPAPPNPLESLKQDLNS